jgi:hypothetical protein
MTIWASAALSLQQQRCSVPRKTVIFEPTEGQVGRPKIRTSEPSRLGPDRHDDPWYDINVIPGDSGRYVSQRIPILPNTDHWPPVLRTRIRHIMCRNTFRGVSRDWRVFGPIQIASLPPLIISDRLRWRLVWFGPRRPAHAPVLLGIHRHGKR